MLWYLDVDWREDCNGLGGMWEREEGGEEEGSQVCVAFNQNRDQLWPSEGRVSPGGMMRAPKQGESYGHVSDVILCE